MQVFDCGIDCIMQCALEDFDADDYASLHGWAKAVKARIATGRATGEYESGDTVLHQTYVLLPFAHFLCACEQSNPTEYVREYVAVVILLGPRRASRSNESLLLRFCLLACVPLILSVFGSFLGDVAKQRTRRRTRIVIVASASTVSLAVDLE